MFLSNARAILTAGILAFATLSAARAEEAQSHCGNDCGNPCVQYKEICVTECVPEYYTTYKTCYKTEKVCETYTAYKCIQVPEKRTRKVTTYKKVPVWSTVKKAYCVSVPCTKTITVMEKDWVCKPVTTYKKKWEDQGHWVHKCVEVKPGLFERLGGMFKKKDCCECDPCPKYETKKVWCPKKVCVTIPCTKMKKVCVMKPVCKTVTTCKKEIRYKEEKVCTYKCIPECKTECYTVCVTKKVPYEAKRWVCKKVPYKVAVKNCRMVKRTVKKKVPVCNPCCDQPCGGCDNGCGGCDKGCH